MKSLGAIFRPFTQCCGAPAAPKMRTIKGTHAGRAQADAAEKTDAVEPSSRRSQATDISNNPDLQEPRSSGIASMPERPIPPPAMPVQEQPLPQVAPQVTPASVEDADFLPEAEEGVAGFPPEAERNVTSEAAPAPGPDGLPEPVGLPTPAPAATPASEPTVVVHYVKSA